MPAQELKFDSPLEERFAEAFLPQLHDGVTIETQRPILRYRADFYVQCAGKSIVLECDGRDYHSFNSDRSRDIDMLLLGGIDEIFRFRGCDIFFSPATSIDIVKMMAPYLFDRTAAPRGFNDKALASIPLKGRTDKPIHRTWFAASEPAALWEKVRDIGTVSLLCKSPDQSRIVAQFKTPYWDRNYSGPKVWSMGDCLSLLQEDSQ